MAEELGSVPAAFVSCHEFRTTFVAHLVLGEQDYLWWFAIWQRKSPRLLWTPHFDIGTVTGGVARSVTDLSLARGVVRLRLLAVRLPDYQHISRGLQETALRKRASTL